MKHRMYRSYILRLVALLLTVTVLLSDFTGFSFANPDEEAVIETEETIEIESGESIVAESESLEEEEDESAETESLSTEEETVIMESDEESQAVDLTQDMSGSDALNSEEIVGEIVETTQDEQDSYDSLTKTTDVMLADLENEAMSVMLANSATEATPVTLDVPALSAQLLATQTLKELYDAMIAGGQTTYELSESELVQVQTHAEGLYSALVTPTEEDEKYKELLVVAFAHYTSGGKIPLDAVRLTVEMAKKPLESKYYFLTEDLHVSTSYKDSKGYYNIPAQVKATIDLNGYAIIGNKGKSVIYNSDGELTIEDSRPNSGPRYFQKQEHAAWILLDEAEEDAYEVYGGIITGGKYTGSSTGGGGIQMGVMDFVTKTTMKGGTIIGNHSNRAGGGSYGGVFIMHGGTIIGNYAKLMGGGVSVSGSFTMNGGYIGQNSISLDSEHAAGKGYDDPEITLGMNSSFIMTDGTIEGNISTVSSSGNPTPTTNISGGTINGNFRILNKNQTTICGDGILNGRIYMSNGSCWVKENGVIQNGSADNGGAVYLANGSFYMEGGAIRNAEATEDGGAVYIEKGKFTMSGGVIENNNAGDNGGAVYLKSGTLTMTGGTFANNTAKVGKGGAAYISGGNFAMTGGTIDSNKAIAEEGEGGAVYVTGGNIYVGAQNCTDTNCLTVSNNTAVNGGAFAVAGATPVMYCGTLSGNVAANAGGALYVSGNGGFTMYGGTIDGGEAESNAKLGGGVYLAAGSFTLDGDNASIRNNNAADGAGVYLTGGIPDLRQGKLTDNIASNDGGGIYINEREVNLNPTGQVTITGNRAKRGAGIYIIDGDTGNTAVAGFSVADAATGSADISQNIASEYGGGVCISNGYFNLSSDKINLHKNEAVSGGAVAVLSGDFTMTGGSIGGENNGNIATNGGAVYVSGGKADVKGGSVQYNTANQCGGGVYISGGDFILEGANAAITNNDATDGGGVYLTGGDPYLLKGTIDGNIATADGGGIFIDRKIVVLDPVADVLITNNKAGNYGAGICIEGDLGQNNAGFGVKKDSSNTAKVTISGNIADAVNGTGGGVCINNGYFNLDSNRIILTDNSAANGGGVAVIGGNFNMSSSEIKENTASFYGGGVLVDGGNAVLSGGVLVAGGDDTGCGYITNNTAQKGGGGIAVRNGNVTMSEGYIDDNTVTNGNGGGLYVESQESNVQVMVYSGSISGNTAKGGNGGAVAVVGQTESTKEIMVQIGVNKEHKPNETDFVHFEHTETTGSYYHCKCPKLIANDSDLTGGACYITGSDETKLNLFCLTEKDNKANGDNDVNGIPLSDFMMVAGGRVIISSSENTGYDGVRDDPGMHGKTVIENSIHITGGNLDLYGNMGNPYFDKSITVDIEKGKGEFDDHRLSTGYVKLMYHENFKDSITNEVDSTLSIYQIQDGSQHTIYKNLYSHDGYTIEGWYTYPDLGTAGGKWYAPDAIYTFYSSGAETGENVHVGDLTLYAIWKVHGYNIEYHPNTNKEPHLGEMSIQKFNYDEQKALTTNAYKWPGHIFTGWNTKEDGSGTAYTDGQEVRMLTNNNGETLHFYAQWADCTHTPVLKGDGTYSVTFTEKVISDHVKEIHKTCDCGYTSMITLTGTDGVYDGTTKYPAKFSAGTSFFTLDANDLIYSAVKIDDKSVPLDPALDVKNGWTKEEAAQLINAGYYTTVIEIDKSTGNPVQDTGSPVPEDRILRVSVKYTVHKAVQLPPPQPEFEPVAIDGGTNKNHLQVEEVAASVNSVAAEYLMEYYVNSSVSRSEWTDYSPVTPSDKVFFRDGKLHFKVEDNYTNYYIYARYKSTDNYKASPESRSDSFFFYTGNTDIRVRTEDGMTGYITKNEGENTGVTLTIQPEPGYYISNRPEISNIVMVREVKAGETSDNIDPMIDNQQTNPEVAWGPLRKETFQITNIATNSEITIYVKGARPIPTISSSLEAGQVYEAVTGDTAVISNDSAYTVAYTVTGYDKKDYEAPAIVFDRNLPAGTNLIMKDMDHNTYWYYDTGSAEIAAESPLPVTSFYKMGSNGGEQYEIITPADKSVDAAGITYTDLHLQFVVDFSEATVTAGNISSTLQIKNLEASPGSGLAVSNAPDLTNPEKYHENYPDKVLDIQATATTVVNAFSLSAIQSTTNELEVTLTHQYDEEGYASKWDYRQEVLILTAQTPLPQDAVLYVNVKGTWSYIDRVIEKRTANDGQTTEEVVKFIISLGNPDAGENNVIVRLQSNMFPKQTTIFNMVAQLAMAQSIAENAGCNAELQGTPVDISFTNTAFEPAVKVYWDGRGDEAGTTGPTSTPEQRVFENGDCMRLMVDYKQLPEGNLYEIKTAVLQETKDKATGELVYLDTAVHPELIKDSDYNIDNTAYIRSNCKVTFNNYASGNYCMMVTVTRGGYAILEAPYYFIIKSSDQLTEDGTQSTN